MKVNVFITRSINGDRFRWSHGCCYHDKERDEGNIYISHDFVYKAHRRLYYSFEGFNADREKRVAQCINHELYHLSCTGFLSKFVPYIETFAKLTYIAGFACLALIVASYFAEWIDAAINVSFVAFFATVVMYFTSLVEEFSAIRRGKKTEIDRKLFEKVLATSRPA